MARRAGRGGSTGAFVLVNANTLKPPVSPVGLEYAAQSLLAAGIRAQVVDLAFETDWKVALAGALARDPFAVGIAVRNTDDCCFATGKSFLPWIREVVSEVGLLTSAPVVLGGVGFSTSPEEVLSAVGADFGICGDAEQSLPLLARALAEGDDISAVPNLARWRQGKLWRSWSSNVDLSQLPLPVRRLVDNPCYQRQGAMVGVETKRGCTGSCIFCADPVAKGNVVRVRPPQRVADEFEDLLEQGVSWFHLCDAEFNMPIGHAREVCRALIERGLGDRIRWYTYAAPFPFDLELARLMKRAGCAGVNFGVDSLDDGQLRRLGKGYRASHVEELVAMLKEAGLNFMFDLMFGGPGETEAVVRGTIEAVRRLGPPLAGASVGVRVYHGTPLWRMVNEGSAGSLNPGVRGESGSGASPVFYVSPGLGPDPLALVEEAVGGDPRFMLLAAPSAKDSYNYAGDDVLAKAIEDGERGAYWDILRRIRK